MVKQDITHTLLHFFCLFNVIFEQVAYSHDNENSKIYKKAHSEKSPTHSHLHSTPPPERYPLLVFGASFQGFFVHTGVNINIVSYPTSLFLTQQAVCRTYCFHLKFFRSTVYPGGCPHLYTETLLSAWRAGSHHLFHGTVHGTMSHCVTRLFPVLHVILHMCQYVYSINSQKWGNGGMKGHIHLSLAPQTNILIYTLSSNFLRMPISQYQQSLLSNIQIFFLPPW